MTKKSSPQQVNSLRFRILISLAFLIFALSISLDAQSIICTASYEETS
jgi:hypothetical protein